jgi:hypothetical protein
MNNTIHFPQGKADVQVVASGAAIPVTITNMLTLLTIAQMTAAGTLNLTNSAELRVGARLLIKVSVDATGRTLTLGTGLSGNAIAMTASKSYLIEYFYDGTNFVHVGTQILN